MKRIFLFAALVAAAAPAAQADDLWNALQPCRSLADGERLSCFDRVLAAHEGAAAAKPAEPMAAPSAPAAIPSPDDITKPAPPPAATDDPGNERPKPADTALPGPDTFILAKVTAFAVNALKHFTITLDNGQVWRQLDADKPLARVRLSDRVKIVHGAAETFTLTIEGANGSYQVKRIK